MKRRDIAREISSLRDDVSKIYSVLKLQELENKEHYAKTKRDNRMQTLQKIIIIGLLVYFKFSITGEVDEDLILGVLV